MPVVLTRESLSSLFIEMYFGNQKLSSGTGFVVSSQTGYLLITNRHNVTGRRQDNGRPMSPTGGVPDRLCIWHNVRGQIGNWTPQIYPLYDGDGVPLWREHPALGAEADFVALPIEVQNDIVCYELSTAQPEQQLLIQPSDPVSIIGFPFGKSAGGLFGIWVAGFMASEPDVNYQNLPLFLVDCRARPGQSGSPVIALRKGNVSFKSGDVHMGQVSCVEMLGIYSGRISEESDLGIVWKREAIDELVSSIE